MKNLDRIVEKLSSPVPMNSTTMFRFFFIIHIALFTLKLSWTEADPVRIQLVRGVMITCVFLSIHWRLAPVAILTTLILQLYFVQNAFPETGNHKYIEFYVLILLLICPSRPIDPPHSSSQSIQPTKLMTDGTLCHLIRLLSLSVYFYAGIQKLLGGRWLSGEYLTQTILVSNPANPSCLGHIISVGLKLDYGFRRNSLLSAYIFTPNKKICHPYLHCNGHYIGDYH